MSTKLARLFDEIRGRSSLGYYPPAERPPGEFCKIEMKLSREAEKREGSLLIRARSGYYRPRRGDAPPPAPQK